MNLAQLITLGVEQNASDLHLSSGNLPMLRKNGKFIPCGEQLISAVQLEEQIQKSLTLAQWQLFKQTSEFDYAFTLDSGIRLRGNLFLQYHGMSAVYRILPKSIPSLVDVSAPAILRQLALSNAGLILITGSTGSGKSTTLAALINYMNEQIPRHIITLEDPIEFLHQSHHSLIQQREIGCHTQSFTEALHATLRQDPDVILLGELRDRQTIQQALIAAETGHLVLASLHTNGAIQAIRRIIDVFPAEEKPFIQALLSEHLSAICYQQLLPTKMGGRIAAYEVLINIPAVAHLIREGKTHQISSVLQTNHQAGMQTMQQAIQHYAQSDIIVQNDD